VQRKHAAAIAAILGKYPQGRQRSAVMALLFLAQREYGHLTREAVAEVAELLGLTTTEVGSLIGFYTLFHDEPGGRFRIQICTDLPCALRGAERFAEDLCQNLGLRLGATSPDGLITIETVMCLAACDKAPMFQVQAPDGIHYHESQTVESARAVIDGLAQAAGQAAERSAVAGRGTGDG
jgi:NADH-quinone oxidoreductase subunit E